MIKLQVKGGAANPSPPIGPALGAKGGEPTQISGKQERYENLINQYLLR